MTTLSQASQALKITVLGSPIPQGSMKAFMNKNMRHPVIVSDNPEMKQWRKLVAQTAQAEMRKNHYVTIGKNVPVALGVAFYFDRPVSVSRVDHTVKPDLDKLTRAIGDALTDIVFTDDSQVTELRASKQYGTPARVEIEVREEDFPHATLLSPRPIDDATIPF